MQLTLDKFTPMNNRVLIKMDAVAEADVKTLDSGLIVVNRDKPKNRDSIATIIKMGSHMTTTSGDRIPLDTMFKVGDKILYYHPAGDMHLEIDGEDYILVRAEDIDMIIEED